MCTLSALKCPLCAQTNFPNIDALRISLIKAANGPLDCPICHELFLGLDKLTIHLFSHTNIMLTETTSAAKTTETALTKRATIEKTVQKTNLNTEVKLEPENSVNSSALIKRTSKENKTKKTRHPIKDDSKIVETLSLDTQYNALPVESENNINNNNNISDNNLSICDICEFTFRDEELRDMHFRLVHQNSNRSHSDLGTPSTEPDFKCHLCSKTFKMKGSLRVHLKVVHLMCLPYMNNSPKLGICDRIRQKEIKISSTVNKNVHCVGQTMPIKTENSSSQIFVATPMQPLQQHQTPTTTTQVTSGFSFGTLALLPTSTVTSNELVHAVDGAPLTSNVLLVINTNPDALPNQESGAIVCNGGPESKVPTNGDVNDILDLQHKNTTENTKIWRCNECAKAFTTKYFLKKHKRLHTGEMPYTCEICARTFTFQQSYHKHLLYHSNEKPHVCSTCGRAFKELSTLHNHERIHSGEKPFKCEVCGKCFRQRVSFLVHTRIHTGIMPYKCDTCQKSFRYKVSQRTHKCQPVQPTPDKSDCENNPSKILPDQSTDDISESFIKEFLENTSVNIGDTQNSPASAEISIINTVTNCNGNVDEALLTKAIDDIIVESCNKMGIGSQGTRASEATSPPLCSDDCNSPTQKLQNLRLYSPQLETSIPDGGGDSSDNIFPQFLLSDGSTNIL